ncbi:hypothetical protein D3C74_495810 [compost metagenome]
MERKTGRLPSGSMIRNNMTAAEKVSIQVPGRCPGQAFNRGGRGRNITKEAGFGERLGALAAGSAVVADLVGPGLEALL